MPATRQRWRLLGVLAAALLVEHMLKLWQRLPLAAIVLRHFHVATGRVREAAGQAKCLLFCCAMQ
jgi:hypothetical protein